MLYKLAGMMNPNQPSDEKKSCTAPQRCSHLSTWVPRARSGGGLVDLHTVCCHLVLSVAFPEAVWRGLDASVVNKVPASRCPAFGRVAQAISSWLQRAETSDQPALTPHQDMAIIQLWLQNRDIFTPGSKVVSVPWISGLKLSKVDRF